MKMKIGVLLLSFAMLFSMAGCNTTDDSKSNNSLPQSSDSPDSTTEDSSGTADESDMPQTEQELVPLGEWADVYDAKGNIRQIRITNVTWDNDAGKALVEEYNSNSTMIEIQDLVDEYSDIGYYIYEYEIRYPEDYPLENEKSGIYFSAVRFQAKKSESGWYTTDNTYIVSIDSTYDVSGDISDIMPGDTVSGKGFGTMIDQYKDEFYLSVSYKDPADDDDADYKDVYFAVK